MRELRLKNISVCFLLGLAAFLPATAWPEIKVSCGQAVLRLSEQAVPLSLVLKSDNTECLNTRRPEPLAEMQSADGVWHAANAVRQQGVELEVGFQGSDTSVSLAVEAREEWFALRVVRVVGARPKAVRFVMLNAAFTETVGTCLNIGWNDRHALCVMAVSPLTDARVEGLPQVTLKETVEAVNRGEGGVIPRVRLTASAQDASGSKLEGAAAAVIACRTPDFERVAREVAHAYGLPINETADGTPVKDSELARGSTFFLGAGLADADRLIRLCREAGIRQVLLDSGSWCSPVGHYAINTKNFPNGVDDLKAFVARLKAEGITAGMHCLIPAGQEAALTDALPARLAEIFNACGFGMVCFDGGEGADRLRSERQVSAFQTSVMRRLSSPVIHLGTVMTHPLWHSLARCPAGGTYLDTVSRALVAGKLTERLPTVKESVDARVASLLGERGDRVPGELGWFGVWPRQQWHGREVEGLQLDEAEYLLCRSIAFDCPVSLRTGFRDLDLHPLAPEILRLFKAYETARLARRFSEATRAPMREPGKEFILLQRQGLAPAFVAVRPVACGPGSGTRAMVGAFEKGSVATFWNAGGRENVTLDLSPFVARVADFDDQRVVALKSADEKLVLPVTTRRLTLLCPTLDAASLEQKIKKSLCINPVSVYK